MTQTANIKEAYIGDGVYASFDGYHIWLKTQRDFREEKIALDSEVYRSLVAYAKTVGMDFLKDG